MSETKWLTDRIGLAPASRYESERGLQWHIVSRAGADASIDNFSSALNADDLSALALAVRPVVWHLNAEVTVDSPLDGQHWDSISTVHASLASAEVALDRWLIHNEVDVGAAHYGEVRDPDCVCNQPDPDTMIDGAVVTWGISRMEVQA